MSNITITDADREAAANLLDEVSNLLDHVGIGQVADLIRDGEYDEHEAVQAFARHRLAAVAEKDAEIERLKAAIKRQASAVRTLQASEETEVNILRRKVAEQHWAVATLDSERDANAILTAEIERLRAFIANPPKHDWWAPGDPDCPRDIKAANGELHTLRCKRCGSEDARDDICRAALGEPE